MNTAEKLRQVADLLDAHPDLPAPSIFAYSTGTVDVTWVLHRNEDQLATARLIRRAIGGEWKKQAWDDRYDLVRTFGDGIGLRITADRDQVCTRRVVGTETVTVPAVDAQPERTEVREVVEWDCDPVLAGGAS